MQSHGLKDRVLTEARQFFVVFAYVWLLLAIFGLHKSLVLSDEQLVYHQGFAILKALALAKVIFVAEELNFGKRFDQRPLIWPVLFKSLLFAALLIGFDLLEKALLDRFWPRAEAKSGADFGAHHLHYLLSVGLITFVALIPFFAVRELGKVFGEEELYDLFFKRRVNVVAFETGASPDGDGLRREDRKSTIDGSNGSGARLSAALEERSGGVLRPFLLSRMTAIIAGLLLAAGLALSLLYYWSPEATLRLTTGLPGGNAQRFISAFATEIAKSHPRVRFELISVAGLEESARAVERGDVNLALIRSDAPPSNGQTIAIVRRDVLAILVPKASSIKDPSQLRDKTIGIVQGSAQNENSKALDSILSYFNIPPASVKRAFLPLSEIGAAIRDKQVAAVLAVGPIGPGEAVDAAAAIARATKAAPEVLALDEADAIGKRFPGLESIDIPEGAFKSRPPVPNDTVKGLAVTYRFVAPQTMLNVVAGLIGKSIFESKSKLNAVSPLASQIEAPDLDDKNPLLPVHPGVAAYLTSGNQSFFDQLQQYIYIIGIPLSLFGSFAAVVIGFWRNRKLEGDQERIYRLLMIADAARIADTSELKELEAEFHLIVASCVNKLAEGAIDAAQAPTSSLAIDHARRAIDRRRMQLNAAASGPVEPSDGVSGPFAQT
jgi:TRAP-type uncharacterized transport system substrate-binding protein